MRRREYPPTEYEWAEVDEDMWAYHMKVPVAVIYPADRQAALTGDSEWLVDARHYRQPQVFDSYEDAERWVKRWWGPESRRSVPSPGLGAS